MARTIRVGIIGASAEGGWARDSHVPAVQGLEGLELVAVATRSESTARQAAAAFGVQKSYGSGLDLIRDPGVDLVTVATRVPDHRELVLAALAAGKHVYCEWPLGPGGGRGRGDGARREERGPPRRDRPPAPFQRRHATGARDDPRTARLAGCSARTRVPPRRASDPTSRRRSCTWRIRRTSRTSSPSRAHTRSTSRSRSWADSRTSARSRRRSIP